jgi:2-keto-4-pentenoate hydratase/2-oxohepta-3-ene-1,7-dioic acid hydratase in catechol pathway
MRLCAVSTPDGAVAAETRGGRLRSIDGEAVSVLLGGPSSQPPPGTDLGAFAEATLVAPVKPRKIVAIGLNYRDHIEEAAMDPPEAPVVFAKFPSSIVGPDAPIVIDPAVTERVDWEVELGVVVGWSMRNVRAEDALSRVFGYTVANDVSARDVQFADGQWVRGKSIDTFCPVGPLVVTAEEIPDPQALTLRTLVNGEVVQASTTALMLFSVAELLAYCSQSFTLEPGDLVLTGTPWGCGEFMTPRRSLGHGDVVEVEVDRIGRLRNPVVVNGAGPP